MMKKITTALLFLSATVTAFAQKPAEVNVHQVNDRRTNGSFAQLTITLELPKVKSSEVTASRVIVKSATDNTGQSLLDPEAREPELEPNFRGSMETAGGQDPPVNVSVTLKTPTRKAREVDEVRGEIELLMPGKDPNSVAEVPKFITFAGKALSHKALKANGVEITLVSAAQIAAEKKKIGDAKRKEYKEAGYEDGEDLENMVKSSLDYTLNFDPGDVPVRVKDPNKRILQVVFVDGAGEVKNAMIREGEAGISTISSWAGAPQPDWKLRVSMKTAKNVVRHTFALKDVPLP